MDLTQTIVTLENGKRYSGLHFTINHTGKMLGMSSLSTSSLCNKYCQEYAKDEEKICSHCYAQAQMKMYKNMQGCLAKNTELLCESIIPEERLPIINRLWFRFEAFGDINNTTQVINYFNICKKNPKVHFALWTKNPGIIQQVLESEEYIKPDNLQIVYSSPYLNKPVEKKWEFVDKIFTVYDKHFIEENDIVINCGAKSCLLCNKCYRATEEVYINEKLK